MASSVTFLGSAAGDGTGSTSEAVTIDLGTAAAGDKIVVVILQANWTGANDIPATVTIDGQTGVSAMTPATTSSEAAAIWYYDDSGGVVGGSSTITVTFASAEALEMVAAYRLSGVDNGAPANTNTYSASSSATATLSLNTNASAIVVAGVEGRSNTDETATWTGLTKDAENYLSGDGYNVSVASVKAISAETPRTITCGWVTSQTRLLGAVAAWNEASAGGATGGQPGTQSRHLHSGRIGGPSRRVAA